VQLGGTLGIVFIIAIAHIGANAAFAGGNKIQHGLRHITFESGLRIGQRGAEIFSAAKQRAIKFLQFQPLLRSKTSAAQSNDIQSANSIIAARNRERRQIFADSRAALHERERADADKLMHETIAGNKGAVGDFHLAAEQSAIGQNDVVAELRVVADVTIRHEKIIRADDSFLRDSRGTMHRDVFAKNIVVANAQTSRLAFLFQILRRIANHATRMENISCPNSRVTRQMDVRPNHTICAKRNVFVDHGVRFDFNARINVRFGMNDGGWVNHFSGVKKSEFLE